MLRRRDPEQLKRELARAKAWEAAQRDELVLVVDAEGRLKPKVEPEVQDAPAEAPAPEGDEDDDASAPVPPDADALG